MKCLTKACTDTAKRTEDWVEDKHCSYAKAFCDQCQMKYWMIKRGDKIYLRDRATDDFADHRKDNRLTKFISMIYK